MDSSPSVSANVSSYFSFGLPGVCLATHTDVSSVVQSTSVGLREVVHSIVRLSLFVTNVLQRS